MVQRDRTALAPREAEDAADGAVSVPVASMVESIVGCKWSVGLLRLLADGDARPSEILRASPGLSAKVMNERLRKMTRYGLVRRTVFGERPPVEVTYRLTTFGERFMGILDEVRRLQAAVDGGEFTSGVAGVGGSDTAGVEGTASGQGRGLSQGPNHRDPQLPGSRRAPGPGPGSGPR